MKFVCSECQELMRLDGKGQPDDDGSMGITFKCPSCEWGMTMLINPGETQMVNTLGVKVGGGPDLNPMAMMRSFLSGSNASDPDALRDSMGKCPFANALKNETND